MRFNPRSLQLRTFLSIQLPTFILLLGLSFGGFLLMRDVLLEEWGVAALSRLARTGHLIDMQLERPKELLMLLQGDGEQPISREMLEAILHRIESLEGVMDVNLSWPGIQPLHGRPAVHDMTGMMAGRHRYRMHGFTVNSPRYDEQLRNRTVSLVSRFSVNGQLGEGSVEVVIAFDSLIEQIVGAPWWHNYKAFLIDENGNVLISTGEEKQLDDYFPMRAFGSQSELERRTQEAMTENPASGTVFGPGLPPDEVSGWFKLSEAPWTMVIIAPGEMVLRPIIEFRTYYVAAIGTCIILILVFIRSTISNLTRRLRRLSKAADDLAHGRFGPPLEALERDEVGELVRNFNRMTKQLQQRLAMKEAIDVAREVQQNLLPEGSVTMDGLEVSGKSLYCDETGGDYFDILDCCHDSNRVGIVVGDVVGHGIGAALLMTTIRALVRCRAALPARNPGEVVTDVNHLLCRDTRVSGSFVTLFFLEVDLGKRVVRWIRAGHEPALVYSVSGRRFSELRGKGVALGVDEECRFPDNEIQLEGGPQVIVLASDGAWEVENPEGEQFGRDRIKACIRNVPHLGAEQILQRLIREIEEFRGQNPQDDDITLVVVKTGFTASGTTQ